MKTLFSQRKSIRLLSLFVIIAGLTASIVFESEIAFLTVAKLVLFCALSVLVFYPCSSEQANFHFLWSIAVVVFFFSAFVFAVLCHSCSGEFVLLIPVTAVFIYLILVTVMKFSCIKALFRHKSVWYFIEDYYRLFRIVCCMFLSFILLFTEKTSCPLWIEIMLLAIMLFLYVMEYLGAYYDRVMLLPRGKAQAIQAIIDGDLRTTPELALNEDARMSALYARIVSYMENKRPYLDDNFDINRFSTLMLSNRTYLSKTINYFSGRNFKQFVNYYRVMYSMDLMKKDPRLSVMELAMMSGFHSVVTYNMAFRLNMNDTPANYKRQSMIDV